MSVVTITLHNRDFKLACPEEDHHELFSLAKKLDMEIARLKQANSSASFDLLLVMTSLALLDKRQEKPSIRSGEATQETNPDFQKLLSSFYSELKVIAEKLDNPQA